MIKRYFLTGTDTGVGKTIASCALLQAANQAGYRSAGYKPIASGGIITTEGSRNTDALAIQANSRVTLRYEEVNPYLFTESAAPHIISAAEDRPIQLARISFGLRYLEKRANWLLVEGAGGWCTPLSLQYTFADWVRAEQLPVILVVGIKLGCINHALLSAKEICQSGLPLVGWIANNIILPGRWHEEYLATLSSMLAAPMLGEIPYLPDSSLKRQTLWPYLNINLL